MKVVIKIDQWLGFSNHYHLEVLVDGQSRLSADLKSYYHLRDYIRAIVKEATEAKAEIEVGGNCYFLYRTEGD